ncbi:MAG: hypothetical protein IKT14_00820, partial [Clostridiales bacterium]|nr:hypothetical protein [Clostridiales bacterium]
SLVSILSEDYDPTFDMFLEGNIGTTDQVDYISDLINDPDVIIVMPDNYDEENPENPDGVSRYITENFHPVDNYGNFIYYAPN